MLISFKLVQTQPCSAAVFGLTHLKPAFKTSSKPPSAAFRSSSRCVMGKFLLTDFTEVLGTHVQFVVQLDLTRIKG